MKPWKFKDVVNYIKEKGYDVEQTKNNEWKVVNVEGNPIEFFAVSHGKGPNREVKGPYIHKIIKAIEEDMADDEESN